MAQALLARDPETRDGLLLCATLEARRGELAAAEATLRSLCRRDPEDRAAWRELAQVLCAGSAWTLLAELATEQLGRGAAFELQALHHRVRASIALGRWDRVTEDIAALDDRGARRSAEAFTAWMQCRRGQVREAHAGAHRVLILGGLDPPLEAEIAAVRVECAQRLGDVHAAWRLSDAQLAVLRARGRGAWVAELCAGVRTP